MLQGVEDGREGKEVQSDDKDEREREKKRKEREMQDDQLLKCI